MVNMLTATSTHHTIPKSKINGLDLVLVLDLDDLTYFGGGKKFLSSILHCYTSSFTNLFLFCTFMGGILVLKRFTKPHSTSKTVW